MNHSLVTRVMSLATVWALFATVASAATENAPPATAPSPKTISVGSGAVQTPTAEHPHVAAIFIANRLADKYKDKSSVFEDLVVAEITRLGFTVISPEDAQKALASVNGRPTELDRVIENESSRLALARNLGADYLIVAGLTTYDQKDIEVAAYGVRVNKTVFALTVTYKIADRNIGGSLKSGECTAMEEKAESKNLSLDYSPLNSLLRKSAAQLAQDLRTQLGGKELARPDTLQTAEFIVTARVQSFTVPNIVKNPNGEYVVSTQDLTLLANGATIVLDGAAIGTAPGRFKGPMGLHKMRVSRDGCRPWEQNVAINPDARFDVDLQLTDESIQRWKEMSAFLQGMKRNEKITDADVKVLEGYAQMLRQSGYKVDVKVDAKQMPNVTVNKNQSLWSSLQ